MSRNTNIKEVLFPVAVRPVLYTKGNMDLIESDHFIAIVNEENDYLFTIATTEYRLVTNHEAIELAQFCYKKIFDTVDLKEMIVFNVITPTTKSYCHIDFAHEKYYVNLLKSEVWIPFIRVTNSYNKTHALRFDLGFSRKLCDNGVVFEKETIDFKFPHVKQKIAPEGVFNVDFTKLKELEFKFKGYIENLNRFHVSKKYLLPIVVKVFNIKFPNLSIEINEQNKFKKFIHVTNDLSDKYYDTMGPTAYAVLNVMTDYASEQNYHDSAIILIDQYQKKVGNWILDFIEQIESRSFSFDEYLQKEIELLKQWQKDLPSSLFDIKIYKYD